jgi:hypothetical protein
MMLNIHMVHIKRFIDKVTAIDNRHGREFTMSIADAKQLKDEIALLLVDLVSREPVQKQETPVKVEIKSKRW